MSSQPWVKKYAPTKLSEMVGQGKAVKQFIHFIRNFPKKKSCLLAGNPGVGKTSLVYAFANEHDYEVVEMNASDKRNRASVEETILPACQQASLFGRKKIVLLDEIDGLSGRKDRGGAGALLKIIKKTQFPIVMTANDPYSKKLRSIRKKAQMVKFSRVNYLSVNKHLREICQKEGVEYDKQALKILARSAQGDLRAAINDLQMLAASGGVTREKLADWQRDQEQSMFDMMKVIFKSNSGDAALDLIDNISDDYGVVNFWLDQNMHMEYRGAVLARGYDCVSCADKMKSRIMNHQHWRFLAYIRQLVSVGVQQAKRGQRGSSGWTKYRHPRLMLKIWRRNNRRKKLRSDMEKASDRLHASAYRLEQDFLPYFKFIKKKNKKAGKEIKAWLN